MPTQQQNFDQRNLISLHIVTSKNTFHARDNPRIKGGSVHSTKHASIGKRNYVPLPTLTLQSSLRPLNNSERKSTVSPSSHNRPLGKLELQIPVPAAEYDFFVFSLAPGIGSRPTSIPRFPPLLPTEARLFLASCIKQMSRFTFIPFRFYHVSLVS